MTTQAFEAPNNATLEEATEARKLMEGLCFTKTRECCDGHESWTNTVTNYDAYVELIRRSRNPN